MNEVFKMEYVHLDIDLKSQKETFSFIAKKAKELKLVTNEQALIQGFQNREKEGSTGFENGFAIPHARIKEVKKAAVFVLRLNKGINWKSIDAKPTDVIIALLVPEGPSGDEHLSILSSVALKLMDESFTKLIKKEKDPAVILKALQTEKKSNTKPAVKKTTKKKNVKIVGITACVVGIAHTYMAEEKLLKGGKELGYDIRIETQGSRGVGTPLTSKEIDEADIVILATDTAVDTSRFDGKKIYAVKVSEAIKNPTEIISQGLRKATVQNSKGANFDTKAKAKPSQNSGVMNHILAGISYMIPVIVLGGICLAFSLGLAKAIWGPEANTMGQLPLHTDLEGLLKLGTDGWEHAANVWPGTGTEVFAWGSKGFLFTAIWNGTEFVQGSQMMSDIVSEWGPLHVMELVGGAAFTLMIPILAGFIANSIAGRAAIAPAMVGAFIGNSTNMLMPLPGVGPVSTPMGFIGAIIAGLMVGYFVKWVNTWKIHKSLAPAMPIFFIPLVAGIGISIIFIYVLGGPIGFVMGEFSEVIKTAYTTPGLGVGIGLGLGLLLGAMASFDMGGPINKIAFVTSSALITMGVAEPMGAMAAAIPVAPIGMGLTTVFFKKFFTEDERGMGVSAVIMGTIGISEGAIPFAIRDPKRAIISNVLGGMVAGGIAGALMITDQAAHGGPIVAILGAVPYGMETVYYFIAAGAGVAVTVLTYGFLLMKTVGVPGSKQALHVAKIEQYGYDRKLEIKEVKSEIKEIKKDKGSETEINSKLQKIESIKTNYANLINKEKTTFKAQNARK